MFVRNPNLRGTIGEMAIALEAVQLDAEVFKPLSEHSRCDLIFGIADEPASMYEEAGATAAALGLDSAMFNVLTPMPGTETFASMHREGRIILGPWSSTSARPAFSTSAST